MPLPLLPLLTSLLPLQDETPAGNEPAPGLFGSGNDMWILMIAIVAIFYFVMIAPEKKQRRKREDMLGALKKGDKVMTTSGMFASVAQVQEDVVTLQVADGVRLRFSRAAIQDVIVDEGSKEKSDKGDKAAKKDADAKAESAA